mgnify:CR=1 FL=1
MPNKMVQEYPSIRETTVFADLAEPILARETRWRYMSPYLPLWKGVIKNRFYILVLALIGLYFLSSVPVISALAFFGVFYYYMQIRMYWSRITSSRRVMWGH